MNNTYSSGDTMTHCAMPNCMRVALLRDEYGNSVCLECDHLRRNKE